MIITVLQHGNRSEKGLLIFRDYVASISGSTAIAFMSENGVTKEEFLAHIGKYERMCMCRRTRYLRLS